MSDDAIEPGVPGDLVPGASPPQPLRRRLCATALAAWATGSLAASMAWARTPRREGVTTPLPAEVVQWLRQAGVPESAMTVVVQPVGGGEPRLSHQPQWPVNPASLMKLVTTYAALDRLGPSWSWSTPLHFTGPLRDGVIEGDLVIRGSGDPTLVVERLWQGLLRLRQQGVREIAGDLVLDRSAFAPADRAPGDFDGDASRPYNVQPDALLLNFHATQWTFIPDSARGTAVAIRDVDAVARGMSPGPSPQADRMPVADMTPREPAVVSAREVPLSSGPCGDWRASLQAEAAPRGWEFRGRYPASCGTLSWPLAAPDPQTFGAELLMTLWDQLGGRLRGRVRSVSAGPFPPASHAPALVWQSPALSEAVRDINKFSNNVMAQQLFLTLALQQRPGAPATAEAARASLREWVAQRLGEPGPEDLIIDNGSGLSRHNRVTAQWLTRLLQHAWASPVMPEFLSSLPVSGLDGTLRRARIAPGRAHLKTGSLRDVAGLAGYVLDDLGQRQVLVAVVQHPQAQAARPALDALVEWVIRAPETRRASR